MKNSEYWKLRFAQLEEAQNGKAKIAFSEIEQQYKQAQRQLEGQIAVWYQRLADNNEISLAEARQYLKKADLKEFKWDVNDYIKYGKENAVNGQWVKQLENASAKYHISKLEALKIQTQQSLEVMFQKQHGTVKDTMQDVFKSGYFHTAYELQKGFNIGWNIAGLDQSQIEKVISKPWAVDDYNFSERIWNNKNKLITEVHNELTQNIMLGADPQKAINNISKKMNTSKSNAGRLVMTEEAYFSSLSQKECFEELGVEEYEIVATLDSHTSEICQELDGKVFLMKDYQAGTTAPPFHVRCRSTTAPYFSENFGQIGERTARDEETGKNYYIPDDMNYKEWKKSFVDGGDKAGLDVYSDGFGVHYKKHAEPVPENNFIPANSIEEAQEFAKRYCNDGFMAKTFKGKIDYKGISLDNANAINKALSETFETVDLEKISGIKVVSPMSAIGKKAFKDGADAVMAYSPVEHGIFINKDILKNESAFAEYLKKSQEAWNMVINNIDKLSDKSKETALIYKNAGRSLVDGTSVEGMLKHELGHHVQWTLLDGKTNNLIGSRMSQFSPKISGYANSSKSEYLAESFSAYLKGEYDILDPEYVKFINSKSLDKSERNGIINLEEVTDLEQAKKRDHKIYVTDIAVDKIDKVKLSDFTDEQIDNMCIKHKELLNVAKNKNSSNEVLFIEDLNFKSEVQILGEEYKVSPGKNPFAVSIISNAQRHSLIYLHNHPSTNNFSIGDIDTFICESAIKTISVVTNQGEVYILNKLSNYNFKNIKKILNEVYNSFSNEEIDDKKFVAQFLKRCNEGGVEYAKSK